MHRQGNPPSRLYDLRGNLAVLPALRNLETNWTSLPLSRADKRAKAAALEAYVFPMMVREPFIEAFTDSNELFGVTTEARPVRLGSGKPDFSRKEMPCVVALDPPYDARIGAGDAGELVRVALGIGDVKAYLGLQATGAISNGLSYVFRLKIFDGSRVDHLDISVDGGRAEFRRVAGDSLCPRVQLPVRIETDRLWIEIPASVFAGRDEFLLSADCHARGGAYRPFSLPAHRPQIAAH